MSESSSISHFFLKNVSNVAFFDIASRTESKSRFEGEEWTNMSDCPDKIAITLTAYVHFRRLTSLLVTLWLERTE